VFDWKSLLLPQWAVIATPGWTQHSNESITLAALQARQQSLDAAARKLLVPVKHTLSVTPL